MSGHDYDDLGSVELHGAQWPLDMDAIVKQNN